MEGRGIDLALPAIEAKLVAQRRGGYCFEHNLLLSAALAALGLAHRRFLARVWLNLSPGPLPPRTHLLLAVDLAGENWLADAGFGGGYCPPLRLADGAEATGPDGVRHRLTRAGPIGSERGEWLLERSGDTGATWQPQIGFDACNVAAGDIECANHWTSSRPGTRFTSLHVASRVTEGGMVSLVDREFTELAGGLVTRRSVERADQWHQIVVDRIGLPFSPAQVAALPLFAA